LPLQRWKIGFICQLPLQQDIAELTGTNDHLTPLKEFKKEICRIQAFIEQVVARAISLMTLNGMVLALPATASP
jgi:hypothetical protein